MDTQAAPTNTAAPPVTRAQKMWLLAGQIATLVLTALALYWSADIPKPVLGFLGMLALAMLITQVLPTWRSGEAAAILAGITLATACWLSADHLWEFPLFSASGASIPLMALVVLTLSLVTLIWGLVVRAPIRGQSRLALGALVGGLLVTVFSTALYLTTTYSPAFRELYQTDLAQLEEVLTAAFIYPLALWLGGIGIRPVSRNFLTPCLAVLLIGFIVWQVIKGGAG